MQKKRAKNSKSKASDLGALTAYNALDSRASIGRDQLFMSSSPNPFPRYMRCKLRYADQGTVTAAASTNLSTNYIFALNGLYDPNITGTGHQPFQYDQLTALYSTYRVLSAKATVTWSNPTADGAWVGWRLRSSQDTTTAASKSLDYLREMGQTTMVPLNNSGEQLVQWTFNVDIATVLGVTRAEYKNSFASYLSSTGANPALLAYLELVVLSATSGAIDNTFAILIEFDAEFSGNYTVGQS